MKRFIFILSLFCALIALTSVKLSAANNSIIIILTSMSQPTIRPNSVEVSPFRCRYEITNGVLYVEPLEDMGQLSVMIMNETTGETVSDVIDYYDNNPIIKTSGDKGAYLIRVTTEYGEIYEGTFSVD